MPLPPSVASLVRAIPEIYQPIYGHPEFDSRAQRASRDRLGVIERVADALSRVLGRKLRVLDVGCAQGYFSLALAAKGHEVTGIDMEPRNVALCQGLAAEQESAARFEQALFDETFVARLDDGAFDLAIACSVLHHVCHSSGVGRATRIARRLAQRARAVVVELALREEPVYWAGSLPEQPASLLEGIAFVRELGRYATHLSELERPLYFASDEFAFVADRAFAIVRSDRSSHEYEGGVHRGTRRYFLTEDDWIVKTSSFSGPHAEASRAECLGEVELLARAPASLDFLPRPVIHESAADWFVSARPAVPGVRLSTLLHRGIAFDDEAVLRGILRQLVRLEEENLFHRDLRSWNVIVGEDGNPHLIDFGQLTRDGRTDVMGMLSVVDAFWSLAYEVLHAASNPRPFPMPRFDPEEFPEPWRSALVRSRARGPEPGFADIEAALAAGQGRPPVAPAAARKARDSRADAYAEYSRHLLDLVP